MSEISATVSTMEVPILCGKCNQIFDEAAVRLEHRLESDQPSGVFKASMVEFGPFEKWKASALASSCHLCSMLLKALYGKQTEAQLEVGPTERISVAFQPSLWNLESDRILLISKGDRTNDILNSDDFEITVGLLEGANQNLSTPYGITWSSSYFGQLKAWLEQCKESHSNCRQFERTRLPRRLIDVFPMGIVSAPPHDSRESSCLSLERMPHVVLRSSSELPATTEYLTLSHRWDPELVVYLSHNTEFHDAIPVELLCHPKSKTFKDAIEVTRHLGYRYIWIDTMCINQEDDVEKAREVSFMDQIYKHSSLNISATGATTAADGLFFDRAPLTISKRYTATSGSKRTFDVIARQKGRWMLEVEPATINTRGWVFQERLLSPRVAHFAQHQIYWECADLDASEECPDDISKEGTVGTYRLFNKSGFAKVTPSERSKFWFSIVETYSKLSLTFRKDRLPAISAIARYFCAKTEMHAEDYMAGHWRADLPLCLYWSGQKRPGSEEYVAPSWSWASSSAGIRRQYRTLWSTNVTAIADMIDALVTYKYEDQFGEISSGFIQLKCSLCKFYWQAQAARFNIQTKDGSIMLVRLNTSSRGYRMRLYWDYHRPKRSDALDQTTMMLSSFDKHNLSDDIFCLMPLGVKHNGEYLGSPSIYILGLILHRTSKRGQYVRVGTFNFYYSVVRETINSQRIRGAILGGPQTLEPDSSLQTFPDGKHLIEII